MTIVLDFDAGSLGKYKLGELYKTEEKILQLSNKEQGYCVYINDGFIDGFFLCYFNGYRTYERFSGSLLKNDSMIDIDSLLKPVDFDTIFGSPVQSFDDGTEINREYLLGEYLIEFSWHYNRGPKLTYIIVEVNK